jgi:hypothetical protein
LTYSIYVLKASGKMTKVRRSERQADSGNLRFKIDAGLLFQLGEQLVARRSVALAELIKNAYDADATKVTVLLDDVTRPRGTIIVEDNGTRNKLRYSGFRTNC